MSDKSTSGKTDGGVAYEILNRIITDAAFRQQVADNPIKALTDAGYTPSGEVKELMSNMDRAPGPVNAHEPNADKPQASATPTEQPAPEKHNFQRHLIERPGRHNPGPRKSNHRGPHSSEQGRRAVK
ncbi:MAG: hypothetical protein ABI670_06165 [Chloroflexota bacterium]